ncbi:MAG: DNA-processing protein DprA [Bacteroidota bacterium]
MKTTEQHHQVALSLLEGIGPKSARLLVAYLGSATAIFNAKTNLRTAVPGFSKERFRSLNRTKALKEAEAVMEFNEKHNISTVFFADRQYPYRLKQCQDAPIVLFTKGDAEMNARRSIAVVGTRNMTSYGKKLVHELTAAIAPYNVQIISGLAYGIDGESHRTSLNRGLSTLGVLGHGLDRIYPTKHRKIAREMLECAGCGLVTEFPQGTRPDRENFPQRNRIVAGMTDATVVVESGQKGGSLITAYLANDYVRDVFAYPGNVGNAYSMGCNRLIAEDKAHLVTCGKDVMKMLGWEEEMEQQPVQTDLFEGLNGDEKKIVKTLKEFEKISLDVLSVKLKLPVAALNALLLGLEMKGLVMMLPGKKYTLGKL